MGQKKRDALGKPNYGGPLSADHKPNGSGRSYDTNGNIIFAGNWKDGKYHGLGRVVFKHRSPLAGYWH
jgi:hypothetical protein